MENKNITPLEVALDVRKFEIDLYWKRAAYFWAFIVSIYTGYVNVEDYFERIALTSAGLLFSLGWYFVNRGSKFWQVNWEEHVSELGDEKSDIKGIFKNIKPQEIRFWRLNEAYYFSVSKINQLLSLYVLLIWIILFFKNMFSLLTLSCCYCVNWPVILITIITIVFAVLLFSHGRSSDDIQNSADKKKG